ncbi:MAG: lytic transglycosylase domain-containing protein [Proteobacteria bacterium]|nr:lytic transglycosylase domain-containing protein [Pseudomonadota bacterium]
MAVIGAASASEPVRWSAVQDRDAVDGHSFLDGPTQKPPHPPAVLSPRDAARYRAIFRLQEEGEWQRADREIGRLQNRLLLGHVLAQRYLHPTEYRSKYAELRDWLAEYADHPDATRIHRLALQRRPKGAKAPTPPAKGYLNGSGDDFMTFSEPAYVPDRKLNPAEEDRSREVEQAVRERLRRGWPSGALRALEQPEARRLLDSVRYDRLAAEVAMGLFATGKDEDAFAIAAAAAKRSGKYAAIAHWTAGIAAWRLNRLPAARRHFEALAQLSGSSPWLRAAGAFWAARSHLLERRPLEYNRWLENAARHSRTFYGLLAQRQLGLDIRFDWDGPGRNVDFAALRRYPNGERAIALVQAGETTRAERELRKLVPQLAPGESENVLAFASLFGMPALAMRLGGILASENGPSYDGARYPLPDWEPADGFRLDRALLFAFARQESNFDPDAKSSAGARGLMQLMPRTASFIAEDRSLRSRHNHRLFDPGFNMSLGQRYLEHLLADGAVNGNLLLLAAAYNGGPGKLARWQQSANHGNDPLLFIESIPSAETRIFIERVLANLWIYRLRLGQRTPSLDAIAAGRWPAYVSLDGDEVRYAEARRPSHGED